MLKRFRHMIMLAIVLLTTLKAGAQMAMPDYVYIGSTKHYNVDPTPESTYTWKIDGIPVGSNSSGIDLNWPVSGKFTLSVQELSTNGCLGPLQTGEVYVYQFSLPAPLSECVENVRTASYDLVSKEIIIDRPDYYTFKPGDKRLNLSPSNFADIIPASCAVEIHWQIDFSPTPDPLPPHSTVTKPPVSGIGQPSEIIGNILFPGDGVDFNNVVHTITYRIVDCKGNISYTNSQKISIKPRPKIL